MDFKNNTTQKRRTQSNKKQQGIRREGFVLTTGDTGGALNPQKCYVHSSLSEDWKEERISVQ